MDGEMIARPVVAIALLWRRFVDGIALSAQHPQAAAELRAGAAASPALELKTVRESRAAWSPASIPS
jgi:hypothetical protein